MAQKAATRRRRCSTAAFCVSFATSHLHKPPLPRHAPPFTSYTAAISASLEVIGGNLLERGRGPFEVCDFMPDLAVFFGPRSHQVGNVTIVMSNTCRSMQILKCFVLCVHAHYVMITCVTLEPVSKLHYELTLGAPKQNFQKQSEPETGSIGSLPLYLSVLRKKVYQFWFLTKPHSIVPLPLLLLTSAAAAAAVATPLGVWLRCPWWRRWLLRLNVRFYSGRHAIWAAVVQLQPSSLLQFSFFTRTLLRCSQQAAT